MFTVWSWTLKGVYFALSAYISFAVHTKNIESASADQLHPLLTLPELYQPSPLLSLTVWVLFEVCFPIAFIVTTIVTFVLIPHALRNKMPTANFFNFLPVIMHNANVVSMAIEIVINRIPFAVWHFHSLSFMECPTQYSPGSGIIDMATISTSFWTIQSQWQFVGIVD
mmetsp:Transcript_17943/g.30192  ORF Transcript_17943/g.30192 Transcript_17943/m.30192 type:complete len:168 (+) Transcript_17943:490-993(+)